MTAGPGDEVGRISIRVVPKLKEFRAKMEAEFQKWNKLTVTVTAKTAGTEAVKAKIKEAAKDQVAKIEATESGAAAAAKRIDVAARDRVSKIKVVTDMDSAVLDRFERRMAGSGESKVAGYEPNFNLNVNDEKLRRQVESKLAELKGLASLPVHLDPEIATKDKQFLKGELDKLQGILDKHAAGDQWNKWLGSGPSKEAIQQAQDFTAKLREAAEAQNSLKRASARQDVSAIPGKMSSAHDRDTGLKSIRDDMAAFEATAERAKAAASNMNNDLYKWIDKNVKVKVKPDVDMGAFARAKFEIGALFRNVKVGLKPEKNLGTEVLLGSIAGASDAASGLAKVGGAAGGSLPSLLSFGGIILLIAAAIAVLLPPLLALSAGFITLAPAILALAAPAAAIALGLNGIKKAATDAGLFADSNGAKKGGGTIGAALKDLRDAVSGEFATQLTEPFKQLGTIFPVIQQSMVGLAGGISKVVAGFIESVSTGQGLKDVNDIIAKVGEGFNNAAPGIKSFTDGILRLVDGIAQKFPGLGKWFSQLGDNFSKAMTNMTTPGEDGMSRLDKLIANVRIGLEGLTSIFQAFWNQGLKDIQDPNFGQGMKKFFDGVREFVTQTLPSLTEGFKTIAELADQVKPLLKLAEMNPVSQFKNLTGKDAPLPPRGVIPQLLEPAPSKPGQEGADQGSMWDSLKEKFRNGIAEVKQWFSEMWTTISTSAATAMGTVAATLTTFFTVTLPGFFTSLPATLAGIGQSIGSAIGGAISGALTMIAIIPSVVAGAFSAIPGIVSSAFQQAVAFVVGKGAEIAGEVASWPGRIGAALASLGSTVLGAIEAAFSGIVATIQAKGGEAAAEVGSWPGKFVSALGNVGGLLIASGAALIGGFISGIRSKIGEVAEAAGSVVAAARRFFPFSPAKEGPFSGRGWVSYSGKSIGEGFADGIGQSTDGVVSTAKALMQAVKDVFGSADGLALNFNFGGMQEQMTGLADTAQSYQKSLGDSVKAGTKPGTLDETTKGQLAQMQQESDAIGVQLSQMKVQKNDAVGKDAKAAVQAQMTELQGRKDVISAQMKQMKYDAKYGEQAQGNADDQVKMWKELGQKGSEGIQGVAQGVMQSHMQDLGISGQGALGAIANYGVGFANGIANKYVFNVSNTQEAQDIKDRETYKQAQGIGY